MQKPCPHCKKKFTPRVTHHLFCSKKCCDGYSKSRIWGNYFRCLINNNRKNRLQLTAEMLEEMLEAQDGKCALSGVPLTKITGHGIVSTNASIDRIKPSGPYTKNNIRLVCRFVNGFRSELSDKDFIWWCRQVAEHNG